MEGVDFYLMRRSFYEKSGVGYASFDANIREFEYFVNKSSSLPIDSKRHHNFDLNTAFSNDSVAFFLEKNLESLDSNFISFVYSVAYYRFINSRPTHYFFENARVFNLNKKKYFAAFYDLSQTFNYLKLFCVFEIARYACAFFDEKSKELSLFLEKKFQERLLSSNIEFKKSPAQPLEYVLNINSTKLAANIFPFYRSPLAYDNLNKKENRAIFLPSDLNPAKFKNNFQAKLANDSFNIDIDNSLDSNQYLAAAHLNGPIRVLAPAGAGKTKTLVNRILFLIKNGISPDKILALAFNAKAAQEMRDRLTSLNIPNGKEISNDGVCVQTFHGFGYEIIRTFFGWIYDENLSSETNSKILFEAIAENYAELSNLNSIPEDFFSILSKIKSEYLDLNAAIIKFDRKEFKFEKIFWSYLKKQFKKRLVTFDDMIFLANYILFSNQKAFEFIRYKFEFILADEFQDLNNSQMLMLFAIGLPFNNVFCVGDDDQTIYGWRGAQIDYILNFEKYYPSAKTVILNRNYRSSKNVVIHSKRLIDFNSERIYKKISPRENAPDGIIDLRLESSLIKQTNIAIDWIENLIAKQNYKYSDFAFLCRYNAYKEIIARQLDKRKIPHDFIDYDAIFNSKIANIFRSILRIAYDGDNASLQDWHNVFNFYLENEISPNELNFIRSHLFSAETILKHFRDHPEEAKVRTIIDDFLHIKKFEEIDFIKNSVKCEAICDQFKLKEAISSFDSEIIKNPEIDETETLEVLCQLSNYFPTLNEYAKHISNAIFQKRKLDPTILRDDNRVIITTIHSTKGNEYKNVIYFNLAKDKKNKTEKEIAEERRVAYVAATRAIDNLLILAPRRKHSIFVKELLLNPDYREFNTMELESLRERLEYKLEICKYMHAKYNSKLKKAQDLNNLQAKTFFAVFKIFKANAFLFFFLKEKYLQYFIAKIQSRVAELENEIFQIEEKLKYIEIELKYRKILKI